MARISLQGAQKPTAVAGVSIPEDQQQQLLDSLKSLIGDAGLVPDGEAIRSLSLSLITEAMQPELQRLNSQEDLPPFMRGVRLSHAGSVIWPEGFRGKVKVRNLREHNRPMSFYDDNGQQVESTVVDVRRNMEFGRYIRGNPELTFMPDNSDEAFTIRLSQNSLTSGVGSGGIRYLTDIGTPVGAAVPRSED